MKKKLSKQETIESLIIKSESQRDKLITTLQNTIDSIFKFLISECNANFNLSGVDYKNRNIYFEHKTKNINLGMTCFGKFFINNKPIENANVFAKFLNFFVDYVHSSLKVNFSFKYEDYTVEEPTPYVYKILYLPTNLELILRTSKSLQCMEYDIESPKVLEFIKKLVEKYKIDKYIQQKEKELKEFNEIVNIIKGDIKCQKN